MRTLMLLLAVLLVGSAPAEAGPRRDRQVAQADKAEKKRLKLKKKIRTMRAIVLAEELDLDEDTAAKLFPILNKYDDEFTKLAKEALDLRNQAEALSAGGDEDALDDVVDDLVTNQRARWDLDEDRFKAVRKVLTAKQAARILVVLPEIDRKILQAARKALAKGKKAKGKAKAKAKGKGKGDADQSSEVMNPFD